MNTSINTSPNTLTIDDLDNSIDDSTIKIWIGTFSGAEGEYHAYFDQSQDISQFGKDIGEPIRDYDPDFIGILPVSPWEIEVKELIKQCPLGLDASIKLIENCHAQGITIANAVIFYSGETKKLEIGEILHQMTYMGEYPLL